MSQLKMTLKRTLVNISVKNIKGTATVDAGLLYNMATNMNVVDVFQKDWWKKWISEDVTSGSLLYCYANSTY